MDDEEIWATIEDAPDYEVSNYGQVRRAVTGRILRHQHNYARPRVVLYVAGQRWSVPVDYLVSLAFGEPEEYSSEIWRTVAEAPAYEVSDEGRVRNKRTGRILRTYPNNGTGRPQVTMMDVGYRITRQVRTLVNDAFG